MILDLLLVITSVLLGSTFSKIIAKILAYHKNINLFSQSLSQNIPSFNASLAQAKSFDILEFVLFLIISTIIFALFTYFYKKIKYSPQQQFLVGLGNLIFATFGYIAIMFVDYSGVQTVVFSVVWYIAIFFISFFIPKKIPDWIDGRQSFFNGLIAGFYLLIVLNNLTTSVVLPFAVFLTTPIYFYLFAKRFKILSHPGLIILILSFIFPFSRLALLGIFIATLVTIFITKNKVSTKFYSTVEKIYPVLILFIILYNPIFYLATFDSIEEGFWSGWLQRLLSGQFIYRDFAAYHPPLLIWGLGLFTKVFGASLLNQRLYFHLLQIFGFIILYLVLKNIVKSKAILIGIFTLIVAYGSSLVRNNIEFRLGIAILPLLFIYWYNIKKDTKFLVLAGITTSLAFFASLETGIASVCTTLVTVILSSSRKKLLHNITKLLIGIVILSLPVFGILVMNGAIGKFFEYIIYYAGTFSSGYQNFAIEKSDPQTLLQWYLVVKYIATSGFLWELTKLSLMGGLFIVITKKIRKQIGPVEILVASIAIFGLILSRSALGRSDAYHIAFVWIPALLLVGYILQCISEYTKTVPVIVLMLLIFFIGRDLTQMTLFQNQIIKFETYGNPSGSYPSYSTSRAGIITGIETSPKEMDDLVSFVDSHVNKNENIFVFPQEPEIYFLTDRNDATSFDTPMTFYTLHYQNQMIKELSEKPPKLIIYRAKYQTQSFTNDTLHEVNEYILKNYKVIETFGKESVMEHI